MESGGSQIFVTHVPTPHLDGRYTIFGELRAGFDVLDVLEVGDTILDASNRATELLREPAGRSQVLVMRLPAAASSTPTSGCSRAARS